MLLMKTIFYMLLCKVELNLVAGWVNVIIRPWGRKIRAYWCYFPSTRGDVLMITLNLK